MTDFDQVVSPLGADAFLRDYWLKNFVHIPGQAGRFADLLSWSELGAILEQPPPRPASPQAGWRDGQPVDAAHYLTPRQ